MSGWDGAAFDRWLATEPEEECIHYGIECDDTECPCGCVDCPVEE